jgi:hypothetical protein
LESKKKLVISSLHWGKSAKIGRYFGQTGKNFGLDTGKVKLMILETGQSPFTDFGNAPFAPRQ